MRVTPDVILRLLLLDLWNAIAFSAAAAAAGVVAARRRCGSYQFVISQLKLVTALGALVHLRGQLQYIN